MNAKSLGFFRRWGVVTGCWLLSLSPGTAASVVASNNNSPHPIALANGALVPSGGGFVAIGSFSLSDAQITAATASPAAFNALKSAFDQFGSNGVFGDGGEAGLYSQPFSETLSAGHSLAGDPLFVVAGNATDLTGSDQLWVFKSNETFGADDSFSALITLDAELGAGQVLIGTPDNLFLPLAGESFDGSRMVAAIPEPAAGLFALLGAAAILARRRS